MHICCIRTYNSISLTLRYILLIWYRIVMVLKYLPWRCRFGLYLFFIPKRLDKLSFCASQDQYKPKSITISTFFFFFGQFFFFFFISSFIKLERFFCNKIWHVIFYLYITDLHSKWSLMLIPLDLVLPNNLVHIHQPFLRMFLVLFTRSLAPLAKCQQGYCHCVLSVMHTTQGK